MLWIKKKDARRDIRREVENRPYSAGKKGRYVDNRRREKNRKEHGLRYLLSSGRLSTK